ncbi:hypothetical protein [Actinoplanes nipponensis]|uniref:Uncharacterized protein n=1 Tax=Actinoplanes nipponensis TaxID=135950 RepID=A0A919JL99_9ACTN|nr:hypothetical protein [Actinoplanes nipponensis]GIE51315.1 hypothetical protein Ani05nite_48490 [Actinoplanes nipponensis]
MRTGQHWLRRHVEIVAVPGPRRLAVLPRTATPQISIAVRRRPAAGRVSIEARR